MKMFLWNSLMMMGFYYDHGGENNPMQQTVWFKANKLFMDMPYDAIY